jgi:formate hydrogenlyase subunit 4
MILSLYYLAHVCFIVALSPLLVGVIRKIKAWYQGRVGARVLQPYADLRKLFGKDEVLPEDASWVFRYAPYLIFGSTALAGAGVPILVGVGSTATLGNIFVFVYLLAIATFFLALAGIDSGSAFGGFGSSREVSLSAIAEAVLLCSLIPLAVMVGSENMGDIATVLRRVPFADMLPVFVACIGFFIALLAEAGRIPVDNPATHLELTMIHEAMILEYSGKRLALIEWASATKLFTLVLVASSVFFPWGIIELTQPVHSGVIGLGVLVLVGKILVCALIIATIESTIAKLRIFRVPRLLFTGLIAGAVALALTAI